jgi:hypothetical protein
MNPKFALFGVVLCTVAVAGDYQPDAAVEYTFVAPEEGPAPSTVVEDRWVESLVANLRKGGASPNVVYRFSRSAATFAVNGSSPDDLVFVSRDDPNVYLVVEDLDGGLHARFIVNFATKDVSARNYGGSLFVPPSKSFCVLVLDLRHWPPGGIPITSAPGNQPRFDGRNVSWH